MLRHNDPISTNLNHDYPTSYLIIGYILTNMDLAFLLISHSKIEILSIIDALRQQILSETIHLLVK